ncbi:sensor domain-containing protein [Streptoalloteichus hindustanus]|uniref:sensor domain-containing protein n=1 Tax=Streptoalloteichus hindustanus TaxID=2017 RepID=UPI001F332443|nr:EAL domain-containing protein [Streptoalloteichus hindustanus]
MADRVERTGGAPVVGDAGRAAGTRCPQSGPALPAGPALRCDAHGLVLAVTPEFAALAGASAPDLVGAKVDDLVVGEGAEARLVRVDGGALPVRLVAWPLADGGRIVSLVDVSDLASAAEALRDEQRRLNEVQRVAGIGSWEFDPATGETFWSPSHYELLGLEPGTAKPGAETVLTLIHPDDREQVLAYWADHKASGAPIQIEYRVLRPDGELRRIRGEAKAKRDARGEIVRITGYIRDITDQWRAETELAAERARLLEAQRIARMGSWSYDVATGVVRRSEALSELYAEGGSDGDFGDLLFGVHPDDRSRIAALRDQLLRGPHGKTVEVEVRGVRGEQVYVGRARAEQGPNGEIAWLQGTIQDVTEQRALERQLREERRRLNDAQRVARLGTWEWDPDTDETAWSDMLHELYGVSLAERTTYQTYLSLVHPDDRDWVDEKWWQLRQDHRSVVCEHRIVRRDGAVRVFRCHGAAVRGPDGRVLLVGTAQDVTEQRATETRMERSSQRFTDLVSITPVGIGLFDDNERLVDANDALCELLGYDLDQLRGMTAEQLTHPDERAERRRSASRINAGQDRSYRIPQRMLMRADGEPVYCELHIAVSVQDDGRRFWLVVHQDITERRRAAEALRHQATHDDLTGLPNRAAVKELLGRLLHADESKVAVLFCDIDNFKRVNDSLGHDAGDELLVALARRLESGLPEGCTAARLSGDEYVIICSDVDRVGGVEALARKVASLLRTAVPVHGQLVRVSAAIGAAVPNGSRPAGADLLRFADAAMFEAKRRGAGKVSLASAALMASADRQVHLEGQLRDALARDGLVLHFQPVVGVDGAVLTAEALVRWPHSDRGLLAPDVFLPVAEQGDLLRELDRWVLRTALREAARWPQQDGRPVGVAVNLAGLVPGDPDFVDAVCTAVIESGVAFDRVVLELVETALVDLPSRTRAQMAELVERGVRFAVDDFGTGYSSLARLKELPAQIVKVDRRFVSGVGNDPADLAVAKAVVDMARAMGRHCVAEGVETATQFHVLRGVGVDAYQGWLFSRPVAAREFRSLLGMGSLHVPRAR